jgi:hypothetical protein
VNGGRAGLIDGNAQLQTRGFRPNCNGVQARAAWEVPAGVTHARPTPIAPPPTTQPPNHAQQINFDNAFRNVSSKPMGLEIKGAADKKAGADAFSRRLTRPNIYWNTKGAAGRVRRGAEGCGGV